MHRRETAHLLIWTALAVAALAVLVGCGGGESDVAPCVGGCQGEPPDRPVAPSGATQQATLRPSFFAPYLLCGPQPQPQIRGPHRRLVEWTMQRSHIVFDDGTRVMMVDVEGTQLDTVVDANPGHWFDFGFHADLSPDGSRIAYSSCEYPTGEIDMSMPNSPSERRKYNYEIASVALDGSAPERLTANDYVDHYPVWSPDMTYVAFLSRDENLFGFQTESRLRVMRGDGSGHPVEVARKSLHTPSSPPLWSPDGERIAFFGSDPLGEGGYEWPFRVSSTLYTVRFNDSELSRISENTGAASWSPDGRRLAVARVAGEDVVLSTIAADGSDSRRIIKITDRETSFADSNAVGRFGWGYLSPVSWSPDGTHILYVCEVGVCVVDLDGNPIGQSPAGLIPEEGRPHATWSPDATRIAVRSPGNPFDASVYGDINPHSDGSAVLFTMARDETDVLVRGSWSLVAENSVDPD